MKKLSLYITLALVSLVFGACSDEYEPWGDPQAYPEEGAITIPGIKANAVATQDLANAGEQVSLFTLSTAELPEGYTLQNARIKLYPKDINTAMSTTINTTLDGKANTAEVQAMVEKYYGKRSEACNFVALVYINAVKNGQAALIEAGEVAVTIIPKAPAFTSIWQVMQTLGTTRTFSTDQRSTVSILAICTSHKVALSSVHNLIGTVQTMVRTSAQMVVLPTL